LSSLDDLDCLVSFTGTRDEAVFYLVPIMVEAEGGRLVSLLLEAMKAAVQGGDYGKILNALEETQQTLPRMSALMKLLHEQCDPEVFYQQVRPFYPGAKGMEEKGMPDGVVFHRSDGTHVNAKCVGGSAAQSSYFQFPNATFNEYNPGRTVLIGIRGRF
jgi:indoleamine 2,3-dioxygenase